MAYQTENETIGAIATGPGGALAIIRLSGPAAVDAAERVWFTGGDSLRATPRQVRLGHALHPEGEPCLAIFMQNPHSYTGEDVVELQCHGGSFAPERLLNALLQNGVRMAEPGEFTRRAFLNGKMDLTQAEAVLDLIQARTADAANLAERQLAGHLGGKIREAAGVLPTILAEIESRMDFPEEDLDWRTPEELLSVLAQAQDALAGLLAGSRAGAVIRNGVRLVIAGAPNVGKSSLLNRILGYDRVIVTNIPGTTRDTVEECAVIRGIQFRLTDTAGVRDDAADPVETFGIERSRDSLRSAEIVLWMLDLTKDHSTQLQEMQRMLQDCHGTVVTCWNKADLCPASDRTALNGDHSAVISTLTGEGVDDLFALLEKTVRAGAGMTSERESDTVVAQRHEALIRDAAEQLDGAVPEIPAENWELAAVRIRAAIRSLGTITGEYAAPDVLDEIFARFCIGK